jgi:hypothetical protein
MKTIKSDKASFLLGFLMQWTRRNRGNNATWQGDSDESILWYMIAYGS